MSTHSEDPEAALVAPPCANPIGTRRWRGATNRMTALGTVASLALLPSSPALGAFDATGAGSLEEETPAFVAPDDAIEPPAIDPTRPMTEEELAALQTYDRATYPSYFEPNRLQIGRATYFWPGELMLFVGRSAAKAALSYGFEAALDEVLPGADPLQKVANQIEGLRSQIQDVSTQVAGVGEQVAELKEMAEWDAFFTREQNVESHKGTIELYADFAAGYERYDEWDETNARTLVDMTANAMAQIELKLVNGIDPAFQNLMRIQRYSEPHERWEQIDRYRRSYESLLATGLLNIMAARERFPSMFQSELDAAVGVYDRTVEGLHSVGGVAYPQPMQFPVDGVGAPTPIGGQWHPLESDFLVASDRRPLLQGEVKASTITDFQTFQSVFGTLRDDYERAAPGQKDFSTYLSNHGFRTSFRLADAVFVSKYGDSDFRVYGERAVVSGRDLQKGYHYENKPYATRAEAEAAAAQFRASALAMAPYTIEVETNAEGHAVRDDVHAIELAMNGLSLERDFDPTVGKGDMGALRIEHSMYDTLLFVDAGTGRVLGAFDTTKGPIDAAVIDAPDSGSIAVLLGDSVPGEPIEHGAFVPVGVTVMNTVEADGNGQVFFAPVSRSTERIHIRIKGSVPLSEIRILRDMQTVCGRDEGATCTVEIDPEAGPVDLWAVPSSAYTLDSWTGPCTNGRWSSKCTIDPLQGEQTITATFSQPVQTEP